MKKESVKIMCFSPTGTTKKILEGIARGMGLKISGYIDFTNPGIRNNDAPALDDELVILGAPVYGGRLPLDAVDYIRKFEAKNIEVVLIVLYGNREYEDALIELKDAAAASGFNPIAAGAFIGEHSFSSDEIPIAQGRPDMSDLEISENFGKRIMEKIESGEPEELQVHGNVPYKDRKIMPAIDFLTITDECKQCGICADECPMDAIDRNSSFMTDFEKCCYCCACIKVCPQGARIMKDGMIKDSANRLNQNCSERKEPELFL